MPLHCHTWGISPNEQRRTINIKEQLLIEADNTLNFKADRSSWGVCFANQRHHEAKSYSRQANLHCLTQAASVATTLMSTSPRTLVVSQPPSSPSTSTSPSNHNQGATMNTTTKLVGAPIAVDYLPPKTKHETNTYRFQVTFDCGTYNDILVFEFNNESDAELQRNDVATLR
jgi:hypothetical protein